MHGRILLIFTLAALIGFQTGCSKGTVKSAEEAKNKNQYWIAIEKYKMLYTAEKRDKAKKAEIAQQIADLLLLNKDYVKAEGWYLKARANGSTSTKLPYSYGEALKMNEKYDAALTEFQTYLKDYPGDAKATEQLKLIGDAKEWISNPKTRFVVEKFTRANSAENDYAPMLFKKEGLYFTSDRPGTTSKGKMTYGRIGASYADIFFMPKNASGVGKTKTFTWGAPQIAAGQVNTVMNDGTPTFDVKSNLMYFTQCNGDQIKKGDSIKNCVIKRVQLRGKEWNDPEELPFCTDTTVNYGQPSLSPDGQRLVFSANLPGGQGNHDLYMSTYVKRGKTWSDPINLGNVINTDGEELFPYWKDDTTLIFSSDGHIGMGGLDFFITTGTNPSWTKPVNMKFPLNSGGDDFAITYAEDGETGYFTSNRRGSAKDDIYSFSQTPLLFTLKGTVRTNTGKRASNARIYLEGRDDNTKIETITNDTGGYFFKLGKETDYEVYATQKFYFPSVHANKTTKSLTYSADLKQDLTIATAKRDITVRGILYDLNSAALRPESKNALDSLIRLMNEIPYVTIELGSHTDCRASVAYNDSLSLARSNSVVKYLSDAGVETDRLTAKGYGESQLVNDCACEGTSGKGTTAECTEEMHQANRRTTVKVLRFDYKSSKAVDDTKLREERERKKNNKKPQGGNSDGDK